MGVSPRTMHVPAGLSIDEATRPELLDVGAANVANRNVRINERGALEKRFGFEDAYGVDRIAGSDRTTGRRVFTHGPADAPCVIDGTYLDIYSSVAEAWRNVGRLPIANYRLRDLPTPIGTGTFHDLEVCGGAIAYTFADGFDDAPCYAVVVDEDTGALLGGVQQIGSGNGFLTVGSVSDRYFVACMYETAGAGSIKTYVFDVQNPTSGWVFSATVASATSTWPAICSVSDRVIIAYGTSSGASRISVSSYDETGLLDSTTVTTGYTPGYVDVDAASGTAWVAFDRSPSSVSVIALSVAALSSVVGTALATAVSSVTAVRRLNVCAGTSTTARVWCIDAFDVQLSVAGLEVSGGAVAVDADGDELVYNAVPASRPFYRDGRYYMTVAPSATNTGFAATYSNTQGLCVLVDWTETATWLRPVVNIEPGLCPALAYWAKIRPLDSSRYALGIQVLRSGSSDFSLIALGNGSTGCVLAEIDFSSRGAFETAAHHGVTVIAGGVVSTFDGTGVAELGFTSRPVQPDTSSSGTGITGTFRYVAIYEDTDAAGNVAVSGVSLPSAPVTVTDKTISVVVPPLSVTSRLFDQAALSTSVRVVFYRTATGGEAPYYRLGSTASDPTLPTVTFPDAVTDADLTARPQLYAPSLPGTVGEALDRRAPPGLRHPVSYAGMLIGTKGSSLFYSGQEVYGEATWFSPVFELPISGAGEITALATQDGALVAFTRDRIYVLVGESPSDNGAAGGLGTPRLLASDVGCIDANSVVATSLGIWFQSGRGIELLTRSQSVEWIGEQIQDTLAAYPVVTSAVVDVRGACVRFTLSTGYTSTGMVNPPNADDSSDIAGKSVIFDLPLKSWISVDDHASRYAAQDACYLSDRYAWIASSGTVHVETDEWLDDGEWVQSSFTLPPWKLGLQQDQRIWEMQLLYQAHTSAGIKVEVAEDYGAFGAITDDKTWTAAEIAALAAPAIAIIPRDDGFAAQLRISDVEPETLGTGRGLTFIGVSADIAQKSGQYRGMPRRAAEARK